MDYKIITPIATEPLTLGEVKSHLRLTSNTVITSYSIHYTKLYDFSRMSKDDQKNGDGANPHYGLLDEYHLHQTTEYYDVLTSGMKTRKQPLLFIITTAGRELNNPCYREEYKYVRNNFV